MRLLLFAFVLVFFGVRAQAAEAHLMVQLLVGEDRLSVLERLVLPEGLSSAMAFPLLRAEGWKDESLGQAEVDIATEGEIQARFVDGNILLEPTKNQGFAAAQVRFSPKIEGTEVFLTLSPQMSLQSVVFFTRKTAGYSPQIRPLAPYLYDEEETEVGKTQILRLISPVQAGSTLRVAMRHLPSPFGHYRLATLVGVMVLLLAAVIYGTRERGT